MRYALLFLLLMAGWNHHTFAQAEDSPKPYQLRAIAEIGFIGVFDHKIQFGQDGTYWDYKNDGGQDVLFPVSRLSLELDIKGRNTLTFLYQPLSIRSQVPLDRDIRIDGVDFPAGTNLKMLYNFPFYRFSYLRHLKINSDKFALGLGGTIQIRNATINFESGDGELFVTNRDIGIVPALKLKARWNQTERLSTELEADGIYAPVSYLNGSTNEIVGAILDASIRQYAQVTDEFSAYLNFRYLGGGAVGTNEDENNGVTDGYTRNWLHFFTVTAGFVYEF